MKIVKLSKTGRLYHVNAVAPKLPQTPTIILNSKKSVTFLWRRLFRRWLVRVKILKKIKESPRHQGVIGMLCCFLALSLKKQKNGISPKIVTASCYDMNSKKWIDWMEDCIFVVWKEKGKSFKRCFAKRISGDLLLLAYSLNSILSCSCIRRSSNHIIPFPRSQDLGLVRWPSLTCVSLQTICLFFCQQRRT